MAISVIVLDRTDATEHRLVVDAVPGVGEWLEVHIGGARWDAFKVVSRLFAYSEETIVTLECDPFVDPTLVPAVTSPDA